MDASRILLALSVTMLLLILAASMSYETVWSSPEAHPTINTMEVGGVRAVEDSEHWGLGLAFGITTIVALVTTLLFATGPPRYDLQRNIAVLLGGTLYLAVFVVMMLQYRHDVEHGPTLLGPFAKPTTWMVFGLWSVPGIFVAIYCVKFETWFDDDESRHEGKTR